MHVSHCGLPLLLLVASFPDPVASESGVPRVESSQTVLHTSTPYEAGSTPNPSPSTVFLSSTTQLGPTTTSLATTVYTSVPQGPVPKSTSISSSSTLPSAFPHPRSNTLSPTPETDEGIETLSLTMSTVGSTTSATPPTTMEKETSSGGAAMLELPFMVGIAVGTFLLVMIIVVTIMLFVVVYARRRRDARKLPVSGEIFTNVVTAANPETVFGKAKLHYVLI